MLSQEAVWAVISSGSLASFPNSSHFSGTQVFSSGGPNQSNWPSHNSYFAFLIPLVLTFGKATPITFHTQLAVV